MEWEETKRKQALTFPGLSPPRGGGGCECELLPLPVYLPCHLQLPFACLPTCSASLLLAAEHWLSSSSCIPSHSFRLLFVFLCISYPTPMYPCWHCFPPFFRCLSLSFHLDNFCLQSYPLPLAKDCNVLLLGTSLRWSISGREMVFNSVGKQHLHFHPANNILYTV